MIKVGDVIAWVSGQSGETYAIVTAVREADFDAYDIDWEASITIDISDTRKYCKSERVFSDNALQQRVKEAAAKAGVKVNL
jgi:hypothetical protein